MGENTLVGKAAQVISEAEDGMRTLIGEAAVKGDYEAVRMLSAVAENLAGIGRRVGGATDSADLKISPPSQVRRRAAKPRNRKRQSMKAGYPRFKVYGNTLLRIGWSRKSQSEYEHRVPQNSFEVIIEALTRLSEETKGLIVAQDLIEECGLPGYQVYAVLGLLSEALILERRSREGYSVLSPNISGGAEGAWLKAGE